MELLDPDHAIWAATCGPTVNRVLGESLREPVHFLGAKIIRAARALVRLGSCTQDHIRSALDVLISAGKGRFNKVTATLLTAALIIALLVAILYFSPAALRFLATQCREILASAKKLLGEFKHAPPLPFDGNGGKLDAQLMVLANSV